MRVTHQTVIRAAQHNLQHSRSELAKLQERASSLDKISRPSDDPIGTADSMQVRGEQRQNEQYARNISNGIGWLASVESALSTATDLIQDVRDLTVQGANDGSLSTGAKEAIAVELEGLREELLNTANTQYLGRTIFAGTADQGVAFNPADLSFNGTGAGVERRIDANTTVRVDVDGSAVFGTEGNTVFAVIDKIVTELRSDTNIGANLTDLDTHLNALLGQHGAMGARQAQILRAEETNMERSGSLEAQRSGIEDVDLGEVVLQLKLQEITYQSALAVTARVLQPTLMDFLR